MSHWTLDPSILLGLAALATLPILIRLGRRPVPGHNRPGRSAIRRDERTRNIADPESIAFLAWYGGIFFLAVALVSPLDYLADHVLFVAHMLQHLLLLLVVPPLFLVGFPAAGFALARRGISRLGWPAALVCRPFPSFLIATVVVWTWHVPAFYEAALASEPLHALEHLTFLGAALLFWWPVIRPDTHPAPMPDLFQFPYLLGAIVTSSLLAAVITFAPTVLYPTYADPAFSAVRASLGLDPPSDQVLGGVLMWVGGGFWYLLAAGVVLVRWFARSDSSELPSNREVVVE